MFNCCDLTDSCPLPAQSLQLLEKTFFNNMEKDDKEPGTLDHCEEIQHQQQRQSHGEDVTLADSGEETQHLSKRALKKLKKRQMSTNFSSE